MKLTQQLLSISEESAVAKAGQQQADLLKAHQKAKKVSADQGVVQHVNKDKTTGRIYASDWYDDDETLASYNNGKLKKGVNESKEGDEEITGEKCKEGDIVAITGNVENKDDTGEIVSFGKDKKFVVVKLFKDNKEYSFHSSDVTKEEDQDNEKHDDSDEDVFDKEEQDTFFVAFYDEGEHKSWIGEVSKADGGKWHESVHKGTPNYRWGTSYMSYLTPAQVMEWIHKDYRHGMEVEGPFDTAEEAEEYVKHNFGSLEESAIIEAQSYTDFDDWKAAVLHSYPAQAKKIKFKGRMEGDKDTISAEVPGEDRSYGVWDQDKEKGVVLSEDASDDMLAKFMSEIKAASIKASLQSGGKLEFNADDNDAVWNIYSKYMQKFRNAGWTATNIERSPGNPSLRYLKLLKPGITEAIKPSELKKAQAYFDRNADADMDYEDIINMLTSEDFSEEVANEIALNAGRKAPKKKVTEAVKDMIEAHGIKGMSRTPWRRTFKDEDAMVAWAEKFDAEIYGQRETDYAAQMKKDKPVQEGVQMYSVADKKGYNVYTGTKEDAEKYIKKNPGLGLKMSPIKSIKEDVHTAAVEWFKAEKPEECPKCKSSDFYRTSFGNTQKIVCSKCGQVAAKKDIKEGAFADKSKALVKKLIAPVKDPILDQMKSITAVAHKRAIDAQNAEFAKKGTVQRTLYKANNKDHETTWTQTGKSGKHMQTGEHTQEWKELDKNGKATGDREWRNMAGEYVGEGASANDRLQARAKELLPVLKGPFKKKESVVAQCAELAAKYFNSAGLQHDFEIDEYIKGEMKKRGITEGIEAAITEMWGDSDHAPDKMSKKDEKSYVAKLKARNTVKSIGRPTRGTGNAGMKTPYDQGKASAEKGEKYDNFYNQPGEEEAFKDYKKGFDSVKSVKESKEDNIAKLRKDYKDAKGWVEMAKSDVERRKHQATVQKIWNHAKNQYKIDLDRKDGKLDEGFSPFKPNARVKIVSGPKDVVGKEGTIGEVVTTNGQKSYTVDYDHDFKSDKPNFGAKSIRLQPKDIKLIRDTKVKESKGDGEQLEVINKAHADGAAKKVFFTGTYEECKEFMRTHKSLKMDLMYKESGRLASYKL
jgi:hypothetical protein